MSPSMNSRGRFFLCLGVALSGGLAQAQVTVTYHTLEERIARADWVVLGKIPEFSRKVIVPANGELEDGTICSDGIVEYTMTVAIDEVLKGTPRKKVQLVHKTSAYDRRVEEWRTAKKSFLWFIDSSTPGAEKAKNAKPDKRSWTHLRLGPPVPAEDHYVVPAPPIFSMNFTVLKEPKEILDRARTFAKQPIEKLTLHTFTIPRSVAERCRASGDANFLVVPVVTALENTVRRLVMSPADFVAGPSDRDRWSCDQLREEGVDALRYFKSAENIALLKGLLDDPTQAYQTVGVGEWKATKVKHYPIRAKAYEILTQWGVEVPKPDLEVIMPKD